MNLSVLPSNISFLFLLCIFLATSCRSKKNLVNITQKKTPTSVQEFIELVKYQNMSNYFCVNGKIVLAKNAKLQVTDLGLIRGYGIFDFLKVENGIPLFIEDHMIRFQNSAISMGLNMSYTVEELKFLVMKLIAKNEFKKGGMKIILTGGYSDNGYLPAKESNMVILLTDLKPPAKRNYSKGIKLI